MLNLRNILTKLTDPKVTSLLTGKVFKAKEYCSGSIQNRMSNITEKHLEDKLGEKLSAQFVKAIDESDGCGGKFSVIVVSEAFRGKTLLQKHRLVNTALADELKEIHAFSQKAYTPEEWEKVQKQ